MSRRALAITLCLLLSACGTAAKKPASQAVSPPAATLERMDTEFLYLAAQDAMHQGQPELAIRFLSALVHKDPDAHEARLQLAELLLATGRGKAALEHLEAVVDMNKIANVRNAEEAQPYILYIRALATGGRFEEALGVCEQLLANQPKLLDARLLQVQLLVRLDRKPDAYAAIATGIARADSPPLRKIFADLLIQDGKLARAEEQLKAMQRLDPDNEIAALALSQLAFRRNKPAVAEQVLRDFIAAHPDNALRSRNTLGRILVQSGRIDEAITLYRELVRDTGGEPEVLSALGLLYFQKEKYAEAAAQFRKAIRIDPTNDTARFYLASSLEMMKQQDEASRLYAQIGTDSPAYVDAQLRLAGIEFAAEKLDAARKRLKAVLAAHPDAGDAYMLLSGIYLVKKEYRRLLDETEAALALPHVHPRLLFNRAIAQEQFKQFDALEKGLKRLLATDPKNAEALNFLGYAYAEQGIKLYEAEALIKRALEQKPDDGYFLDSLAWVYFQRGEYDKAVRIQRRALKQVDDDPVMHEHYGDMLWKQGEQQAARAAWQQAIDLKHDNPAMLRRKIKEGLR